MGENGGCRAEFSLSGGIVKNILVTGGAGFIGSNFVRLLLSRPEKLRIINLDFLTYAGCRENLRNLPDAGQYFFIEGDICDGTLVNGLMGQHQIDTIVSFAAESHVDRSISAPAPFVNTNVLGTLTLLEAARKHWLDEKNVPGGKFRFHHISTDEVYGSLSLDEPAWTEDAPYSPNSPYAASKAASDHLVRSFGHTYGLPYTITNCSNNYGPHQHPEKLIPRMILNAVDGKQMPIYGDGQQIRDWLFVEDHCQAIWMVLEGGRLGETYNLGGGVQEFNLTVVRKVCTLLDDYVPKSRNCPHSELVEMVEDRPGHDRRYAMNASKIREQLGWEPTTNLDEGLAKTVRWYLDHPRWAAAVRKKFSPAKELVEE